MVPAKDVVDRARRYIDGTDQDGEEEEEDEYEEALKQRILEGGLEMWDMLAEGEPPGIGPPSVRACPSFQTPVPQCKVSFLHKNSGVCLYPPHPPKDGLGSSRRVRGCAYVPDPPKDG